MEFTTKRTVQIAAYLLFLIGGIQALSTLLSVAGVSLSRPLIWGLESMLFILLAVFAGAAMTQAKNHHVGWSAIAFSAVFNVVQISVGLTMFGAFRSAANQVEGLAPAAGGVVAFSFMLYYAAKFLLGFAALIFGMGRIGVGSKAIGSLTAFVGVVAMLANTVLITLGRGAFLPSSVAGGSGVLATLLLALCLISVLRDD